MCMSLYIYIYICIYTCVCCFVKQRPGTSALPLAPTAGRQCGALHLGDRTSATTTNKKKKKKKNTIHNNNNNYY